MQTVPVPTTAPTPDPTTAPMTCYYSQQFHPKTFNIVSAGGLNFAQLHCPRIKFNRKQHFLCGISQTKGQQCTSGKRCKLIQLTHAWYQQVSNDNLNLVYNGIIVQPDITWNDGMDPSIRQVPYHPPGWRLYQKFSPTIIPLSCTSAAAVAIGTIVMVNLLAHRIQWSSAAAPLSPTQIFGKNNRH